MIKFDEKTHRYYDGEKELISVTKLLSKHGLSPDYSAVSKDVLQAKAERGSLIHDEIDLFNRKSQIGFTEECAEYAKYISENRISVILSEFTVYNDICAGRADMLFVEKGQAYLADIKTTVFLHTDAVSWQLSIYAYLYSKAHNRDIPKLRALHFPDRKLRVVDIPLKPIEEIEKLFDAERRGEIYKPAQVAIIDENQLSIIAEAERIISEAEERKKEAENILNEVKAAAISAMEKNGVKTFETDKIKLTYVAPTTRSSIDTTRLKNELPEIAERYTKTSEIKSSLRITIKE